MKVELDNDGNVLNTLDDDDPSAAGEWYPDDTVIKPADLDLMKVVASGGVLRIMPPAFQAADWPTRAARQWNAGTKSWDATGGQTSESALEKAIRLLRNNPVPDAPADLPASPTTAQVVQQVRDLTDQVQAHQQYIAGYRVLLLRVLVFLGQALLRG